MQAEREIEARQFDGQIFREFKGSLGFRDLYSELFQRSLVPLSGEDFQRLVVEFKGAIFAAMARDYLEKQCSNGARLLSKEETLDVFKILFPHAQESKHHFGTNSLYGISVPDGLLISEFGRIKSVVEYTLSYSHDYFDSKTRAFRINKSRYPELFENSSLTFVTPRFMSTELYRDNSIELPFTRFQFRRFADEMLISFGFFGKGSASIEDIQSRVREQLFKGRSLVEGSMTPEWASYLSRVS